MQRGARTPKQEWTGEEAGQPPGESQVESALTAERASPLLLCGCQALCSMGGGDAGTRTWAGGSGNSYLAVEGIQDLNIYYFVFRSFLV